MKHIKTKTNQSSSKYLQELEDREDFPENFSNSFEASTSKGLRSPEGRQNVEETPELNNGSMGCNLLTSADQENKYINKFRSILKTGENTKSKKHTKFSLEPSKRSVVSFEESLVVENEWLANHGGFEGKFAEGQTTQNFVQQISGFYDEMAAKLKLLKNSPVLKNMREFDINFGENYLQDSFDQESEEKPSKTLEEAAKKRSSALMEYSEYLASIKDLDSKLSESSSMLTLARTERLTTQVEMCNEIYRSRRCRDRDTQLFLELCEFERCSEAHEDDQREESTVEGSIQKVERVFSDSETHKNRDAMMAGGSGRDFVKRNIELAKQGMMATCSLTDEEKQKLESLLLDIDNIKYEPESDEHQPDSSYEDEDEDDSGEESREIPTENAFKMSSRDKERIGEINKELNTLLKDSKEQIKLKETKTEKSNCEEFVLEHSLKDINKKLKDIEEDFEINEVLRQQLKEANKEDIEEEIDFEDTEWFQDDGEQDDDATKVVEPDICSENIGSDLLE